VGKRVQRRRRRTRWIRLPAVLILLFAAGLMVTSGGHRSVAADSPAKTPAAPPVYEPEKPQIQLEDACEGVSSVWKQEEPEQPAGEPAETAGGPVAEGAPVEDTYFEQTAFLGDSRTEGFRLYSGLNAGTYYTAVGATVESVFSKKVDTDAGKMPLLDAMKSRQFDRIYVMLGVNELGWNGTDTYYQQYGKLIDRLREDHPDSEVVLQTLPPVSAKQEAKKTYVNNTRIQAYNEVILRLAEEKQCPYLDVAAVLSDERGFLRDEWTSDGVHLNTKGCKVWLEYLRTHPVGTETAAEQPAAGNT
jgi:lysophospholipase L1-like esterase